MKKVFYILVLFSLVVNIFSQTTPGTFDLSEFGVKIEPDKRLIAVMIALEASGLDTQLNKNGKEFRTILQKDLLSVDQNLRDRLKAFVNSYKSRHPKAGSAELVAPFVSMAYSLSPAPELNSPTRTIDLPDDLLEVLDFAPMVKQLFNQPIIKSKFSEYLQIYQTEGEKLQFSASEMVTSLSDYLRLKPELVYFEKVEAQIPNPKNPKKVIKGSRLVEKDRRFFIVPDLLATAGTVNFRNIRDDYYAVVPPNTNLRISEARRGYLQFILDPLILKYNEDITQIKAGVKALLEERRNAGKEVSPDIYLAVLRSLVVAIDARELEFQRVKFATSEARRKIDSVKDVADKQAISSKLAKDKQLFADETLYEIAEAFERGAVLAFHFADQLKGFEDAGFSIESSLRDMILSVNPTKESNRLAQATEARKRIFLAREERRKKAAEFALRSEAAFQRTKILKEKLDEIEKVIDSKDYPESTNLLNKLLEEFPEDSANIYYNLGRVASLSAQGNFDESLRNNRLDTARTFYVNAIRSKNDDTDPALIQLSYVALGRIFEFYDENNMALQIYQTAVKYGQLKGGGYNEALEGIKRLSTPKNP